MFLFVCFYCYIRQEKDGLLSEALKSFNCALAIDRNQQTAKDRLQKIQLEINPKKEVGSNRLFLLFLSKAFFLGTVTKELSRGIPKRESQETSRPYQTT